MEFLVEFEVIIPGGISESDVNRREQAEAAAATKLVDQGHLVRVWKLTDTSGQVKIAGLYRAGNRAQLDELIGRLPLRDWMNVTVTPLDPHPNDPAAVIADGSDTRISYGSGGRPGVPEPAPHREYLVAMTTQVPAGTPADTIEVVRAREAGRSRELALQGHLLRLWRPPLRPGEWRTLGLFAAADVGQLRDVLASMPLHVWRSDQVTALESHPNDPPAGRR